MYRKYYLYQKGQQVVDLLPWGHITILLSINDIDKLEYYKNSCIKNNLSRNQLIDKIKLKEYERLPERTKEKLKNDEKLNLKDSIQNPIIIKNNLNVEKISEKVLQKLVIEDVRNIMKQLGEGFSFIDNEYKIKLGNTYNYIDLLLYNYIFKCFVVVELKVTNLKKEHIGQVQIYMNYMDDNVKKMDDNKTIGIIIVKENNEYIIKYSSDNRIHTIQYLLI